MITIHDLLCKQPSLSLDTKFGVCHWKKFFAKKILFELSISNKTKLEYFQPNFFFKFRFMRLSVYFGSSHWYFTRINTRKLELILRWSKRTSLENNEPTIELMVMGESKHSRSTELEPNTKNEKTHTSSPVLHIHPSLLPHSNDRRALSEKKMNNNNNNISLEYLVHNVYD